MLILGSPILVFPFIVQLNEPACADRSNQTMQFISDVSPSMMSKGVMVRFMVTWGGSGVDGNRK